MTGTDLAIPISSGTRILVVDEDTDAAAALVAVLRLRGFNTHGVRATAEARAALSLRGSEVLIVDPAVRTIDGCELIRQACRLTKPPVVIALSGATDVRLRTAALQAGAATYVLKPSDPDELVELIGILTATVAAA